MNLSRDGHVVVCRVTDCQGHWHGCTFESGSWQKSLAIHASPNRKEITTSEIEPSQHHRWKPEFLVSDWRNSGKPDWWQRINVSNYLYLWSQQHTGNIALDTWISRVSVWSMLEIECAHVRVKKQWKCNTAGTGINGQCVPHIMLTTSYRYHIKDC